MYNSQNGVWSGIDPYGQYASPYIGMGSNPANMYDEDGGWSECLSGMVAGAAISGVTAYLIARK